MANDNRKVFLAMNAGTTKNKNGEKIPYVFHCESYVSCVGDFRTASDGKPAVLNLSVAVGRNPWFMLGKSAADEQANNPRVNEEMPFVNLSIFGENAERLKDIQKGAKIVFSGRPEKDSYKKKDTGEDVVSLRVVADTIYRLESRSGDPDAVSAQVSSHVNCYEGKNGEVEQMVGMFSGTVKSVETLRTTPANRQVISAKLELAVPALEAEARINRSYNKDVDYGSYKTLSISVWGPRAAHMDRILVPGSNLVITGSASVKEAKDGRKYVNASVRELSVLKWADTAPAKTAEGGAPASNSAPIGDCSNSESFEVMADFDAADLPF